MSARVLLLTALLGAAGCEALAGRRPAASDRVDTREREADRAEREEREAPLRELMSRGNGQSRVRELAGRP
jgi:hypothetical protein